MFGNSNPAAEVPSTSATEHIHFCGMGARTGAVFVIRAPDFAIERA